MSNVPLRTLVSEKRFEEIEERVLEALEEPLANADFLREALLALARAGQKPRLKDLAGAVEQELAGKSGDPALARLRWDLLKESVRAGATPSTTDGFHKLFEEAIAAAYPQSPSLNALLGRFRFRDAKEPADGLTRMEKAEKWLPFEVGRCFSMTGRGAGRVVETNYALDAVRLDFEKAKGVAVPIGVAHKSLVPLPTGHYLERKLSDPKGLAAELKANPAQALRQFLESIGRAVTMTELKEGVSGLLSDDEWTSFWAAARRNPQVVVHGTGKNATVEWTASAGAADDALVARFDAAPLPEKVDLFRKHAKRSPELTAKLAVHLADAAHALRDAEPARAFEIAALLEKSGLALPFHIGELLPTNPLALLAELSDRASRERLLDLVLRERPEEAPQVLAEWFFKEEDVRTIEAIDRKLLESAPEWRERTVDKLLKNARQGPRAFVWFAQKAVTDEGFRARLNPAVLGRLLDAISWDELPSGTRAKVREMFDRTGLAAAWLVKQATVGDARAFLEALTRHHDLEHHRRDALLAAAEMKFPELRKQAEETFFVTPESIEAKRLELERILKVDIPENTKGIALAAAEGDLSENFEYKARRDKQQLLSVRAGKLQDELSHARPIDTVGLDASEIRPGVTVTLSLASGQKKVTLLGPWDSKPEEGIYSYLSDLGKALLGKLVGDEVSLLGEAARVEAIAPWR